MSNFTLICILFLLLLLLTVIFINTVNLFKFVHEAHCTTEDGDWPAFRITLFAPYRSSILVIFNTESVIGKCLIFLLQHVLSCRLVYLFIQKQITCPQSLPRYETFEVFTMSEIVTIFQTLNFFWYWLRCTRSYWFSDGKNKCFSFL